MAYRDSYDTPFGMGVPRMVSYLLIANAVVFVLCQFQGVVPFLALRPADVLRQPWTLLTYMFAHAGGFHLLFNMIVLFFFGRALEERWGSTEFLKFYVAAGLGGALLSFITPGSTILGASGAVNGLMMAFAMIWPESPIHLFGVLPVKAKWLVAFLAAFSLAAALGGTGAGVAHWAHLGGFAAGFAYLRSGLITGEYAATARGTGKAGGIVARITEKLRRRKLFQPKPPAGRRDTAAGRRVEREIRGLDEIDRILEKISAHGLKSLTPDERKKLEDVSKKFRA